MLFHVILLLRLGLVDLQGMEVAPLHLYSTADDVQQFAGESAGTQ